MNNIFEKHLSEILKDLNYNHINIIVQIPKNVDHGDLSTPVAMNIAKKEGKTLRHS